jgi:hypothetical protein
MNITPVHFKKTVLGVVAPAWVLSSFPVNSPTVENQISPHEYYYSAPSPSDHRESEGNESGSPGRACIFSQMGGATTTFTANPFGSMPEKISVSESSSHDDIVYVASGSL